MKNVIAKATLREIKGSFGRWAAILAIVALGVGFFSGLRICEDDFTATGDQYTAEHNLYDYQLLTTLGLEEEDVDIIRSVDGVANAEGTYSADALITLAHDDDIEDIGDVVVKVHTLSDSINTLSVVAGSLPSAPNEFAGDSRYFSEEDIGTSIFISDTNDEDTLAMFAYDEYVLTAIVDSPVYLNFERGSTSLGNGNVSCFIYIPEGGWSSDVYTSVYVDFSGDYALFSDEYTAQADIMEGLLEDALDQCARRRYDAVILDAEEQLSDAEAELNSAEDELLQHQQELDDAKQELEEGQAELADSRLDLEDGERQLAAARAEIASGEYELAEARKELEDGEKALTEARSELENGRAEYDAGLAEYESERETVYSQLDAALAAGLMTQTQYDVLRAQADSQFAAAWDELEDARLQLEAGEQEIKAREQEVAAGYAELEAGEAELAQGRARIAASEAELSAGYDEFADAEAELADGQKEIDDAESEIADGQNEIGDARAELEDARKEIDDIEFPLTYVLGRDTNIGYACFENDVKIVNGISRVFPIFFFLVAALVCVTTMSRMIDEQRTQIGVLKALGYDRRHILGKYIFYSGSAAVIGSVAGFLLGTHLFPWVIWAAYDMMYGFSDLVFVPDIPLFVFTLIIALLCSVGTTIYTCSSALRSVPAQLIRPKSPKAGRRIWLEHIPFIWNRLGFLIKVSLRNTFRYRGRFIMMVLGICGCTALLLTGLGIRDSISDVVSLQYDEIYHTDYSVSFRSDMDEDAQTVFLDETEDVVSDALFLYNSSVDVTANGVTKSVNLVVCDNSDDTSKFIDLHNKHGQIDYPSRGECVINSNLASQLGLDAGDSITATNSDMQEITVTITDLCDNYVYNYLYINDETYEENWGNFERNSAYLLCAEDEDGDAADAHVGGTVIMNADNVSSVTITQDFRDRISNMMNSLNYVVLLVVLSAGALAFIVLYNLTNINITERVREIATIKVLGFYPNETSAYVFRENIILTAISAVLGMPFGKLLNSFVMSQINIDIVSFDVRITALSYVIGVAVTFLFAFIVNLALQRKLQKISMTESLKSTE